MDLRLLEQTPSTAERAAVDRLLGPPATSWDGAAHRSAVDEHVAYGGSAARAQRHLLLPALHALQDAIGWITPGGLNYICERLTVPPADAFGVAQFYHLLTTDPRAAAIAFVCDDIACRGRGAEALLDRLAAEIDPSEGIVEWTASPCLGRCEAAPAAYIHVAGTDPVRRSLGRLDPSRLVDILSTDGRAAGEPDPMRIGSPGAGRLLRRVGVVDPASLDGYRAHGGYEALAAAVGRGPDGVLAEVEASGLRGRGGAAFPAGVKWRAVAETAATPRYVIANADESEPGTFKDRMLMEGDPFALLESMAIAGFAVGAERGYIYLRGEYPEAEARLTDAIQQASDAGLLGSIAIGEGFRFEIEIRRGGGAYVCGEETALFNSIEGYRGEPRQKPPFPTEAGLFGRPTLVNNVETLYNILEIVVDGGDAFAEVGTTDSTGTKLWCLSGDIAEPGLYEFEFGASLGDVLDAAGGVPGTLAAVLVGGAAGSFVGPDRLDVPLTFEGARAAGMSLGSGVIMPFTTDTDFQDITRRIAEFFRDESCGQCVPCRVGTIRQEEALARIGDDPAAAGVIDDLARAMQDASICGLGQLASGAVQSALALGLVESS